MTCAIVIVALLAPLIAVPSFAQSSPRDLYQRARMLDESNQNPAEAIRLYSQFISIAKNDRALAAMAQYRIGVLYERMGRKADAQKAFRATASQYADQSSVAARAQARIKTNDKKKPPIEIERTGPSPDGRFLATFTFPPYAALSRPLIDEQRHRLYIVAKPTTPSRESKKLPPGARKLGSYVYWPSTLVVIDTRTLAIVKTVPLPVYTSGVALSTVNDKLYTSELVDGQVRVIDPITFATVARIPAPVYPLEPLFNPTTKKIYVASQGFPGNDRLSIIDPLTNSITRMVGVGGLAQGVVINPATNRIYVQREESTRALNGEDGSVIAEMPEMWIISADPVSNRLYAQELRGNERPSMHVLDGVTHDILATLAYKDVSRYGGVDTNDRVNRIYIALTETNQIIVVDAITHREINRFEITGPDSLTSDRATGNVYVCYRPDPFTYALGVLSKEVMEEEVAEEFFDDFDGPELDHGWIAPQGKSSYSLTQNPGCLRYSISRPTENPRPVIARKFRGEDWTFEIKVSYFMSVTGGGRGPQFVISFDEPKFFTNPFVHGNGIHLSRFRSDWDGRYPGDISAFFTEKGAQFSFIRERPNAADTYFYRLKRNGRIVTVERSDDGSDYTLIASRTFEGQIDGHMQHLILGYSAHGASDGYVDIDYVRLTRLSPQGRR